MGEQVAARVKAAGDRIAAIAARLPPHRSMQSCLNRSEGIASSDVEGILYNPAVSEPHRIASGQNTTPNAAFATRKPTERPA